MLKKEELKRIGYDYVITKLNIQTKKAEKQVKNLQFLTDEELAENFKDLSLIRDYFNNDFSTVSTYIAHVLDIDLILKKIDEGITLSIVEIFEIKKQLIASNNIANILKNLNIEKLKLYDLMTPLLYLNNGDVITNSFAIYDKYHSGLKQLRNIKDKLEQGYLNEINEEVKAEILLTRNEVVMEEQIVEESVRQIVTHFLKDYSFLIKNNIKAVILLDIYVAKATLANQYEVTVPTFTKSIVDFKHLFNPYLKEIVEDKGLEYTNITVSLNRDVTLLTGANMGGKSSVIDAVILNAILGRTGFYVFAEQCNLPLIDDVFYLYSKGSDSAHGLSSFGSELIELNRILKNSKKNSLIVIDEFAQTTNPLEGRLFVKSLIDLLKTKKIYTLISTHYDNVGNDITHYQVKGLKEDLKGFDLNINSFMDYNLELTNNNTPPRQAVEIAKILLEDEKLLKILLSNLKE